MKRLVFLILLPILSLGQKGFVPLELPNGETIKVEVSKDSIYSGFNHKMEFKSSFGDFRGIRLKEVLGGIDLIQEI